MKISTSIIAMSLFMALSSIARADDQADLNKTAANLDAQAKTNEGQQRVLTAISNQTAVPVTTLQAQRTKTGFGFGELLIANSLATATGKTFDDLAALKASGKGWGEIAKENNVKLGDIVSKAHEADQAAQHSGGKDHPGGKDQSGGPGRGNGGAGSGAGPRGGGGGHGKGR